MRRPYTPLVCGPSAPSACMCHATVIEEIPSIVTGSRRSPSRHGECVHWCRRCWRRGGWQWAARSGRWPWSTSCCAAWTPRPRCARPTLKAAPIDLAQGKTYSKRHAPQQIRPISCRTNVLLLRFLTHFVLFRLVLCRCRRCTRRFCGCCWRRRRGWRPPSWAATCSPRCRTRASPDGVGAPPIAHPYADMTVIRNHSSLGSARHSPQGKSVACSTNAGAIRAPSGAAALTLLAQQRRQDVAVACLLCAAPARRYKRRRVEPPAAGGMHGVACSSHGVASRSESTPG